MTEESAQTRMVAETVAKAAIVEFVAQHPELKRRDVEVPAPLKWIAAIVSAIFTAGAVAMCIWVVSTLSDLQQTVTRIDERQKLVGENGDARFNEVERRVTQLEAYHRAGGK